MEAKKQWLLLFQAGATSNFCSVPKAEFGLMAQGKTKQSFPDSQKLLTQPSILIGDTVTTMDMMPHEMGMVNKQMSKESMSIVC